MAQEQIQNIPLQQINEPWIRLRHVDRGSIEYLQIRDSIADPEGGLLSSICVRPDPRHPGMYEVVDGLYRLTAFRELGRPTIPAIIRSMSDERALAEQVRGNALRRETTPVEFARQIRRIQRLRLDATGQDIPMSEMAVLLGREVGWIAKTLSLLNLKKDIQKHVERDELKLCNAYMLAKIPPSLQSQYLEYALHMPVPEFNALAESVIRGVMEAARNGRLEALFVAPFAPQPYLRPLKRILEEIEKRLAAAEHLLTQNCKTPLDGWLAALKWAANLDPQSVLKQQKAAAKRHSKQHVERDRYVADIENQSDPDP